MAIGATDEFRPGNEGVESRQLAPNDEGISNSSPRQGASDAGLTSHQQQQQQQQIADTTTMQNTNGVAIDAGDNAAPTDHASDRGRPTKKRSFDDLAADEPVVEAVHEQPASPKNKHHKRMRSRDIGSETAQTAFGTIDNEVSNPAVEQPGASGAGQASAEEVESMQTRSSKSIPGDAPPTLPNTDEIRQTSKPSGFANVSTESPFGTKSAVPSKAAEGSQQSTSSSAFAASGLSAFSNSASSPFKNTSGAKSPLGFSSNSTTSGFGGAPSTSGFGSTKSGFGSGTSTFGSSSGLSSFGTPKPFGSAFGGASKPFGTSSSSSASGIGFSGGAPPASFGSSKPFGGSSNNTGSRRDDLNDEDENEEENGDHPETDTVDIDTPQDPRFKEQHIDTGEEHETTEFTCRAKIYHFVKGEGWKERGVGALKINTSETVEPLTTDATSTLQANTNGQARKEDDHDPEAGLSSFTQTKRKARLLMRADGVHRVILNSPIFKGMKFGDTEGNEPFGRLMHVQSLEEGRPVPLQVKINKEETLKELFWRLKTLEAEL